MRHEWNNWTNLAIKYQWGSLSLNFKLHHGDDPKSISSDLSDLDPKEFWWKWTDPWAVFIACFIRMKYAFMSLYVHVNKLSRWFKARGRSGIHDLRSTRHVQNLNFRVRSLKSKQWDVGKSIWREKSYKLKFSDWFHGILKVLKGQSCNPLIWIQLLPKS